MLGIDSLSKPTLIALAIFIYLLGVVITTIICHKLKWEEEDIPGMAWFFPILLPLWLVFHIFCIPIYIYRFLDKSGSNESDFDESDYDEDWS